MDIGTSPICYHQAPPWHAVGPTYHTGKVPAPFRDPFAYALPSVPLEFATLMETQQLQHEALTAPRCVWRSLTLVVFKNK